ncbi:GGDEF domain-containing protein [Brucella tritici]|uniref:diguanylate cyclase n=1 Tax=Brucella tritici TaxID=94626 RepID=A0A6L3YAT1_9HYPH|nr:GGDEF domain-containing protein [Brucella tritici]KAB2678047.1 GGDEF domain-containing protein [Brucella tritici]
MDTRSVYITVTLVILANGGVLTAVLGDLPQSLRPAARIWQAATLLVAIGCIIFAIEDHIPYNLATALANTILLIALCSYHASIRKFHGLRVYTNAFIVPAIGAIPYAYYLFIVPDIGTRIFIVALLWGFITCASAIILIQNIKNPEYRSRGSLSLTAIYVTVTIANLARTLIYLFYDNNGLNTVADNGHWMNAITPMFLCIMPVIGTTSFLLMCSDQVKKRWEDTASRDHLTDLPNRRSLMSYGEARLENAPDGSYARALAMLDIDEFKCINDGYGHQAGDEVLQEIADRIVGVLQPDDFIARSGGEEFVVIFGKKGSMSPEISAERVRQAVASKTFQIGTTTIPVTVSIGVVVCRANATFSETLSWADKALYAAKNKGRNKVVYAEGVPSESKSAESPFHLPANDSN